MSRFWNHLSHLRLIALLGLLTLLTALAFESPSPNNVSDIKTWTDVVDQYKDDFVFTNFCGFEKKSLSIPTDETPPLSSIAALRNPAITPPAGCDKFKFQLFLQGIRVYVCNVTDPTGWSGGVSRSCLFNNREDLSAVAAFVRTAKQGMIGTLQDPWSAVGLQVVASMPVPAGCPGGNTNEDLDWEMTQVDKRFGSKGHKNGIDFTDVSYVNRVLTRGGQKPSKESCTSDNNGKSVNLAYTAHYWFWGC